MEILPRRPGGDTGDTCKVYSTPGQRREKLAELSLEEELLVVALQRGITEKLTAMFADPKTAGGYDLWRYATRYLREQLHARGWIISDRNNVALVRDPVNGTILIVCSGDSQTGSLIGEQPRTRRSKGDFFLDISEVLSTDLFGHDVIGTRRIAAPHSKVWLLLHYHDGFGAEQVFRAELSRPYEAVSGMITKWAERVILHTLLPGEVADDSSADDQGPNFTPNITVNF